MTDAFIAHARIADAATVTAGNEVATLPATNLQNMQPSKRWRTSGLANVWVQYDLGAATAIDLVAICSHNAQAAGTWQIRASADSTPATAPDYDSGALNLFPGGVKPSESWRTRYDTFKILPSTQTWRYWRLDFTVSPTEGYFEAGRAIFDLRQSLNIDYSFGRGIDPADQVERTPFGGFLSEPRARPRVMAFGVNILTEADEQAIYAIDLMRGIGQDVLVCDDPDATTYLSRKTMLGAIMSAQEISRPDFGLWFKRYEIREIL